MSTDITPHASTYDEEGLGQAGVDRDYDEVPYTLPGTAESEAHLRRWQQLKFGMIIHWGLYTRLGRGGSWTLCPENKGDFMLPGPDWSGTDEEWSEHYYAQANDFEAPDFDASAWASAAAGAGMRYMVFTAKHHDGFAMYDTQLSDLKVTGTDVPFGRDVMREFVDAFRAEDLLTGVYYSKADWGSHDYWDPSLPLVDRRINYDLESDPERWARFVEFTHGQVRELLSHYGPMEMLWLDGGWVREPEEDLEITKMGELARELQPGILVVDRTVSGPNEDYRTPEQEVPDGVQPFPWESCITLGDSWCTLTRPEQWKSAAEVIGLLVRVAAYGGNLLLGVGPDRTGALPAVIEERLAEIGDWLGVHGAAIYGTRPVPNAVQPADGDTFYTRDDSTLYIHRVLAEGGRLDGSLRLALPAELPEALDVRLLGQARPVTWTVETAGTERVLVLDGLAAPAPAACIAVTLASSGATGWPL